MADNLTGARKAAIFLMMMGEDYTAKVFKHLDERDIKILGEHMAQLRQIDSKVGMTIMDEFSHLYQKSNVLGFSGKDFLEKTVAKAFDNRKAGDLLDDMLAIHGGASFDKLSSLSPQILANILVNEHPQTIALILVNMKYQTAAEVVAVLPENVQGEVIMRIADLDDVPNEVVHEVQEVIEEQLANISKTSDENLGGITTAAEILNHLDHKTENSILEKIEESREELAEEIRQSMFVFEDLSKLDDRSIRSLLKEISNDELILALKTASEDLSNKIFSNVSQRAAQMMKEDMEIMGPVRLRDVEQAQLNIIKVARRLAEEGKIILGGKGAEDVLV